MPHASSQVTKHEQFRHGLLERVLRENPESLTSILTALISALETHRNPIGAADEEPEEDGVYALTEV